MRHLITSITLFATLLSGCGGMKAYLPIIDATLVGGKGVVVASKDYTISKEDLAGCYITSALITAMDTSKVTIDSWITISVGDRLIPSVDVDLSACYAMGDKIEPVIGEDANTKVQGLLKALMPTVTGVLGAVLESNDVTCRDLAIAKGVLKYIENAAPAIVEELADPDGKMSLPAVTLKLSGCDTSSPDAAPRPKASVCQ